MVKNISFFLFQLNGMSNIMLCLASVSTLCCISADRYLAVVRPMRYKQLLTPKRAIFMLAIVWFGSFSLSCVPLITDYEFHPGINNCSPAWHRSCLLYAFMAIFSFGVPFLILLSTYGMIFHSVRQHTKRVSHWSASSRFHDSFNGTDTTGSYVQASFASLCTPKEVKQNRHQRNGYEFSANDIPKNSRQNLRICESKQSCLTGRHCNRKFRSHSTGCNRISPGKNFLPLLLKTKAGAAAKPEQTEGHAKQPPQDCSFSFSFNRPVTGTVSEIACPDDAQSNEIDNVWPITRSLSLSCVHPRDSTEHMTPLDQSSSMQGMYTCERMHCFTVTTTSTPEKGPKPIETFSSALSGSVSKPEAISTHLLQHISERNSSPFPEECQLCSMHRKPNKSLLHPPALPNSEHLVEASSHWQQGNDHLASLETSHVQESKIGNNLTHLPSVNKMHSPLLRLRAISKFKRKVQVNTLPHEYKIAKIGFLLVLVFFFSWGPYMMVHNCHYSFDTPLWVHQVSMWMVHLSCVFNPIIYALSSRHIRLAFSHHLKCLKRS